MWKDILLNSIIKDLRVIKRLSGKIPLDQMNFRPKENVRSTEELLKYLSFTVTAPIDFWLNSPAEDFRSHFGKLNEASKNIAPEAYPAIFEQQIEAIHLLFEKISESDLLNKEVTLPSGTPSKLGEAILETSVKWLSAYKMQLFLYIKISTDHQLTTPDLWRKVED